MANLVSYYTELGCVVIDGDCYTLGELEAKKKNRDENDILHQFKYILKQEGVSFVQIERKKNTEQGFYSGMRGNG